jgi:hypothetical protein
MLLFLAWILLLELVHVFQRPVDAEELEVGEEL